tara:strand:+ start:814 stop:1236 length:423 start_codon:yes stop_codon:yes gene_type:complete
MAHYAFLDNDNFVVQVFPGKDEGQGTDWESEYSKIDGRTCLRTSYNTFRNQHKEGGTPFRGNYAGIGSKYDSENDVFISPKPFESWVLDTNIWAYVAPKEKPTEEQFGTRFVRWHEDNERWRDIETDEYWDNNTSTWNTP